MRKKETQMSNITTDLRAALDAAISDLTEDQAHAARALLDALTTPAMDEPTWPGAPVMATCSGSDLERLHIRRNVGRTSGWECRQYSCVATGWRSLINPRPLTPDEYAEYGIPAPCTHGAQDFCGVGQ